VQDPSFTPPANTWHHVAITYDGFLESVYVDGTLRNQEAKTLRINQGHQPLKFALGGAAYLSSAGGGDFVDLGFSGYIAALRMHTGALTGEQVLSNYQAGIEAVPEPTSVVLLAIALGGGLVSRGTRRRI
jgi:hypothetical protein